jgi:hypothetical protein
MLSKRQIAGKQTLAFSSLLINLMTGVSYRLIYLKAAEKWTDNKDAELIVILNKT